MSDLRELQLSVFLRSVIGGTQ